MNARELDRVRFVTQHFQDLQGLRTLVPMGMIQLPRVLSEPAIEALPVPHAAQTALAILSYAVFAACAGGALLLISRSPAYYRSLLGEVQARSWEGLSKFLWGLVPSALVLLYLLATGSLSYVRVLSLLFGAGLLSFWFGRECRWSQIHLLLLGGMLLAIALFGPSDPARAQEDFLLSLGGASWVLAGLIDHWQLVHALGDLPPPDHDEAGAAEEAR